MSVNVASRISDVTSCPRTQMFVASDVAIAVRQGSMSSPIIPTVRNGRCYGADTVTPKARDRVNRQGSAIDSKSFDSKG